MLKRYIILAVALSFMAVSVPKCPFSTTVHSAKPLLAQASTSQPAITQSAAPRL